MKKYKYGIFKRYVRVCWGWITRLEKYAYMRYWLHREEYYQELGLLKGKRSLLKKVN